MPKSNKIRIAFIKFGGMAAGGTEKFLQTIAANLPKDRFEVDYYYCDAAPYIGSDWQHPDTDPLRIAYMQANNVNLIKFKVGFKDVTKPTNDWVDTNFWEVFDESKYDLIQMGRAGHPEYPFHKIRKTPLIDSLHLSEMVDNQYNIARVMHISQWSADKWVKAGGDARRNVYISVPIEIPNKPYPSLKESLGLNGKFVFGFHQRNDNSIFSEIPLKAYQKIEKSDTAFVLLNGSDRYREQVQALGLKNIHFLPYAKSLDDVYSFLATLDVFAHGRKDGEVNSSAMAEAMYFGLPIVSHFSEINNGHVEAIGDAGRVVSSVEEYQVELLRLLEDKAYYHQKSSAAKRRFETHYKLQSQIEKVVQIYEDAVRNPYLNRPRVDLKECARSLRNATSRMMKRSWRYATLGKRIKG